MSDLYIALMWPLRVRMLSKTIPGFLAEGLGSTLTLPIRMGVSGMVFRNLEWIGRNSVLLSLSFSEFRGIQLQISVMHAFRAARESS